VIKADTGVIRWRSRSTLARSRLANVLDRYARHRSFTAFYLKPRGITGVGHGKETYTYAVYLHVE
jgi:hypothetical protein